MVVAEQAFLAAGAGRAGAAPGRRARDRRGRRRARRDDVARRRRGLGAGLRRRGLRRRAAARRPADADLHVGHHRPAEGRRARSTATCSPPSRASSSSSSSPTAAASSRGCRRRTSPSARPTTTCRSSSACRSPCCPNPREILRVPARGAPELVLRGPADLGEAEGRAGGDAGRAPGGGARGGAGRPRGGDPEGPPRAGRRAGARGARGRGRPGRRAALLRAARDARASTRSRRATSARRRRRSRCSSSSTRSASRSPSCGACARPAARARCNPPDAHQDRHGRPADAGRASSGSAEDGELLVRGARRHARLPQPARQDRRGARRRRLAAHRRHRRRSTTTATCKIVDRKKELIINAAGKNMSPANIEATLKAAAPLIGQACVHRRRAPVQHRADRARRRLRAGLGARARASRHADLEALAADERVRAAVQQGVDAANAKLSRVEQIKRFHIVTGDWLPGGDELTPDDEAQAQADRREVRDRDRGAVLGLTG